MPIDSMKDFMEFGAENEDIKKKNLNEFGLFRKY